jgi:hypothetical protein
MSNLVKYNTVYSSKLFNNRPKTFLYYICLPCKLVAWLVYYRQEQKENEKKIKALQGEIKRLDLVRASQERIRNQQQQEQEQTTLEHVKRIIQKGNNITVIENKTYTGRADKVKEWWLGE